MAKSKPDSAEQTVQHLRQQLAKAVEEYAKSKEKGETHGNAKDTARSANRKGGK